jgi:ABC-2 type transport system permease protein
MTSLRVFVLGGLTSYRAMFHWLTPWILIPVFIATPIFEILFFAFVGRTAGVGDDRFFLIGNAVLQASIPCLFAMGNTIGNERQQGTLPLLLVSPARRIPLFLGRALPVVLNGFLVAVVAMTLGALLLRVPFPPSTWPGMALAVAVASFSCTGLGLLGAAIALRVRETAVLSNLIFGMLMIFAGVNVPLLSLPGWMAAVANWLPLTHGIVGTRKVAAGAGIAAIRGDLLAEAGLGVLYVVTGCCCWRGSSGRAGGRRRWTAAERLLH